MEGKCQAMESHMWHQGTSLVAYKEALVPSRGKEEKVRTKPST